MSALLYTKYEHFGGITIEGREQSETYHETKGKFDFNDELKCLLRLLFKELSFVNKFESYTLGLSFF